eukprot:scaffold50_cov114-Amphora_coffeaeformis.AAC.2
MNIKRSEFDPDAVESDVNEETATPRGPQGDGGSSSPSNDNKTTTIAPTIVFSCVQPSQQTIRHPVILATTTTTKLSSLLSSSLQELAATDVVDTETSAATAVAFQDSKLWTGTIILGLAALSQRQCPTFLL